jgi:hypothetical protein
MLLLGLAVLKVIHLQVSLVMFAVKMLDVDQEDGIA